MHTSNTFSNDLLWNGHAAIRRNKCGLWSLLNQQNRVIDWAPHVANSVFAPLASRDGSLKVLMSLSWFQNSKKGGHLKFPRPPRARQARFQCLLSRCWKKLKPFLFYGIVLCFKSSPAEVKFSDVSNPQAVFFFFTSSMHTCPRGLLVICCEYDFIYS